MSTARRRPHRIDLSFGPGHGPVSGVLNAAAAILALTMWMYVGQVSPMWGFTAGIGMAGAGILVARHYAQPGRVMLFRGWCWGAAGLWSLWTLSGFQGIPLPWTEFRLLTFLGSTGNPWTWHSFVVLLVGTATLATAGWSMERAEQRKEREAAALAAQALADQLAAQAAALAARVPVNPQEEIAFRWQPFLRKIMRVDVGIVNVEKWDPFYGFTLDCELPGDGTVLSDVKRHEESLATSAPEHPRTREDGTIVRREDGTIVYDGLPDGCGVEIMPNPGMGRRNFLIKVTTVSALGQDIAYPDDLSMETVENPLALGVEVDRKEATIPVRTETTVLVGNTDSGKSNQLNVITTGFARCTDVLLVGIDVSGNGRMMRPWIRAYKEGRAKHPTFAQVAPTVHRARLLCASLINIINGRTADYAQLMHDNNWDKIEVSPGLPQIVLVVDEGKLLPQDIKDMIEKIVETGRGAAVRVVYCALEAVSAAIPKPVIKHSRNRIGMRVVDEAELVYLFDSTWKRGRFDPASLPWRGSGLYANGPEHPIKFKGYRIDPQRVEHISVATGDYRPELDALSLARGDTVVVRQLMSDGSKEDVEYTGVWATAEADTYPLIFPDGTGTPGAGTAGTAQAGGTATIVKEDTTMSHEQALAQSFGSLKSSLNDLDASMDALEADANGTTKDDTDKGDDGDQGDAGDGDPDDPTVAELNRLWRMPTADEPQRPTPGPTTAPAAPAAPAGPLTPQNTQGRPSPKRRARQLTVDAADTGGTGGSDIHRQLVAEGYPTSITTVQNWLKIWKAGGIVTQDGDRGPYFPGPKMGDPYQP